MWTPALALALNVVLLFCAAKRAPRAGRFEPLLAHGLRRPPPGGASSKWAIGGLLILGTVLRLHALEAGPWIDEIHTWVRYARRPLGEIVTTFDSQNQHLLYSALARVSIDVLGDTIVALRFPAVVFGVLGIAALWRFALWITDRREALFAAALLTVSYHHVWFSQNARGYTALLFFTLLGSSAFLRMLGTREPDGWGVPLAYGVSMALAVATHATAVFVVAAHAIIWLALVIAARSRHVGPNRWAPAYGFVLAGGLSVLAYSFVLPSLIEVLLAPTMPGRATEWKQPSWLATESFRVFSRDLPGGGPTAALAVLVGGLGLFSYTRQSLAVLATLLLGALLTGAVMVLSHHNLWPRLFFFSAGFFVLIGVRGFAAWVALTARAGLESISRGLLTAALTLACFTSAATLPAVYGPKQDFGGALEFIETRRGPEDAVLALDMAAMPYREHYGVGWPEVDNVTDLTAIERMHPRTWVVYTTPTRFRAEHLDIWRRLEAEYEEARTFPGTVNGGEVVVMVRTRPAE